jgi:hypothetical protein
MIGSSTLSKIHKKFCDFGVAQAKDTSQDWHPRYSFSPLVIAIFYLFTQTKRRILKYLCHHTWGRKGPEGITFNPNNFQLHKEMVTINLQCHKCSVGAFAPE